MKELETLINQLRQAEKEACRLSALENEDYHEGRAEAYGVAAGMAETLKLNYVAPKTDHSNAIAISCDFHTHPKYEEFYKIIGSSIGGFIGIYDVIGQMAAELTKLEEKRPDIWDEQVMGRDWMEFVEIYVDEFIKLALHNRELPSPKIAIMLAIAK